MLAQHLITRPVFDAVFEGHEFVKRNPVSQAMSEVLSVIDDAQVGREAKALEGFYASVRRRAAGITDPQARQNLIVELYDKFFRKAFPLTTQKLGTGCASAWRMNSRACMFFTSAGTSELKAKHPGAKVEKYSGPAPGRRSQLQFSSRTRTEYALELFARAYPTETIGREDIFHYIYGLLHSEDYRERFRANLAKELPRIPCVASVEDYRAFRDAGRRLGELHVGYESVERYPAEIGTGGGSLEGMDPETAYRVTKMRHPGTARNKDRTTVIYNPHITVRGIPEGTWNYVVSGKPALQWVMERSKAIRHRIRQPNRNTVQRTVGWPAATAKRGGPQQFQESGLRLCARPTFHHGVQRAQDQDDHAPVNPQVTVDVGVVLGHRSQLLSETAFKGGGLFGESCFHVAAQYLQGGGLLGHTLLHVAAQCLQGRSVPGQALLHVAAQYLQGGGLLGHTLLHVAAQCLQGRSVPGQALLHVAAQYLQGGGLPGQALFQVGTLFAQFRAHLVHRGLEPALGQQPVHGLAGRAHERLGMGLCDSSGLQFIGCGQGIEFRCCHLPFLLCANDGRHCSPREAMARVEYLANSCRFDIRTSRFDIRTSRNIG